jgi:hypothetical protein
VFRVNVNYKLKQPTSDTNHAQRTQETHGTAKPYAAPHLLPTRVHSCRSASPAQNSTSCCADTWVPPTYPHHALGQIQYARHYRVLRIHSQILYSRYYPLLQGRIALNPLFGASLISASNTALHQAPHSPQHTNIIPTSGTGADDLLGQQRELLGPVRYPAALEYGLYFDTTLLYLASE